MNKNISFSHKTQTLRKEFQRLERTTNDYLTKEELFIYIDRKLGREFDRSVAIQLYDRMD